MGHPLCTLSGTRLARMIRERQATSADVVEAHIARILQANPTLNAVVHDRFDEAREEAREADERVCSARPGDLPPLHGVPCTIKECFALTGMPNTAGLPARVGLPAEGDATAVARLRRAGAIPLGVTNVSELCMWMETDNRVYGRTNNPYDPERTVGGSSGGEGAIIAAGGAPFGLGSDIGGSIRLPSFFNGVFGHKPTGGMVPSTGQFPLAEGAALRYLTTGPLARRAEDLWPLLRILAGPDGFDEGCREFPPGDPAAVDLRDLRVLSVEGNGAVPVARELLEAQRKVCGHLARRGACVEPAEIRGLRDSLTVWSAMLSAAGGRSFASLMGSGREVSALWELALWMVGRGDHTLPAIGLAALEKIPHRMTRLRDRYVARGAELRDELVRRIGPRGVMLYPSYPTTAPRHGKPLLPPFQWIYTALINVLELPATQVPLGLSGDGLPLGVQVIGIHGNDHLTLAVAQELERAFGGWVPPPRFS
jgi:fatty acid amide hydrolase 2